MIGGIGLGVGYISPVSTLVKWFPDRRGLATGIAVMGFGAGASVTGPIAGRLIEVTSIPNTFYILGVMYLLLMSLGASYLERPQAGWMPPGMKETATSGRVKIKTDLAQMTASEAIKTPRFWLLWTMMFINISAGIMILSVASPMAQEITGMSVMAAATMVGLIGLFNGAGRIGWAAFSDYIGRQNIYLLFFAIQVVAFFLLPYTSNDVFFSILAFIIVSCYGGGFSCLPAFIGDIFGTKQLGAIHGYLLTSWSMAGIAGPMIVSTVYDATKSYTTTFYIFDLLLVIAFFAAIGLHRNLDKLQKELNGRHGRPYNGAHTEAKYS